MSRACGFYSAAGSLGADNRWWSQAFAMAHSRSTVAVEISSASATSGMLSPAKNRSSTTRHCRTSNEANASSASSRASTSTLDVGWSSRWAHLVQADHRGAAATLVGPLSTGVVDEDLAHQPGRHRKEVRAALQRHAIHIHESQEDLVHERRRLEDVSGRFPPEMTARHPSQLVIHQRNQAVERRSVSLSPGQEEPGYVGHAGVVCHQLVMGKRSVLRF